MAKVTKIYHNCKHCKKELHPSSHTYYKCDDCGGIVCSDCYKPHEGQDLCQHCHHKLTSTILGFHSNKVIIGAFIVGMVFLAIFFTWFSNSLSPTGYSTLVNNYQPNDEAAASLDLFVMSQCPYGVQAEDLVMPILEKFEGKANFNLYFIAREAGGSFTSLHGQPEVDEDTRQLVIIKNYPDKFFDYLTCFNKNYQGGDSAFESCAAEAGIDAAKVKEIAASDEGKKLFSDNVKKAGELQVQSSPTIYVNGAQYSGSRSEASITAALCEKSDADACSNIKADPAVLLKIVNDPDCTQCDPSSIVGQLKSIIPSLKTEELAYDSADGRKLIDMFSANSVPVLIFDSSITGSSGYAQLQQYLVRQGEYSMLRVSGIKMLGREEKADSVQLFIMSQCPYGTMAQATLKEVAAAVPKLNWDVYFIANDNGDGTFESLHGQPEVDEDLRQVCILAHAKDKYFAYTTGYIAKYNECGAAYQTSQDSAAYQKCLAGIDSYALMDKAGVSRGQILTCAKGQEGQELLQASIAVSTELEVSASPTFLFNNAVKGSGADAETLKNAVCSMNNGLEGCDKTLTQATGTATAAAAGQCN